MSAPNVLIAVLADHAVDVTRESPCPCDDCAAARQLIGVELKAGLLFDPTEGPDAGHRFKPCMSDQCDLHRHIDEQSCHAEVRPGYFCGYAEEQHEPRSLHER